MFVFMHVHVYMCGYMHVCMPVCKSQDNPRCHFPGAAGPPFETGSVIGQSSLSGLGCSPLPPKH